MLSTRAALHTTVDLRHTSFLSTRASYHANCTDAAAVMRTKIGQVSPAEESVQWTLTLLVISGSGRI